MSETSDMKVDARPDQRGDFRDPADRHRRRRRPLRIALVALGSLLGLVIVAAIGSYAYVNHLVNSIPRVHVANLVSATSARETFLVTADPWGLTGTSHLQPSLPDASNLVMLLHINASGAAGGSVTIPGNVVVDVPGQGNEPIWDALETGGPSLLVKTVEHVTGVPINHYARIDFEHISNLVNTVGGIDVTLPHASRDFGYTFAKGVNHLNGTTAIYYARDPAISNQARLLRQENLVRVLLAKIADDHLLTNPITMVRVLNSIKSMLTVDSNLTSSQVESLATKFGNQNADAAIYVTAVTHTVNGKRVLTAAIDDQLWTAIKQDKIAAFAQKYPSAVTPAEVP